MSSPRRAPADRPLPNTVCPLCGGPNACAPAELGRYDTPCWCTGVRVDPAALARAGTHAACLCRRCAESPEGSPGFGGP